MTDAPLSPDDERAVQLIVGRIVGKATAKSEAEKERDRAIERIIQGDYDDEDPPRASRGGDTIARGEGE